MKRFTSILMAFAVWSMVSTVQSAAPVAEPALPAAVWPEKGSVKSGRAIAWDGNTIEIDGQAIRLFGIDAPKMGGDPRGPVARAALDAILGANPMVTCEARDIDRFKRPVASCRAGGQDIARAMVLNGYAFSFRRYSTRYDDAEAEARAKGIGFWNGGAGDRGWVEVIKELTPFVAIISAIIAFGGQAFLKRLDFWHERQGVAAALSGEISSWLELVDLKVVAQQIDYAKRALEDPGLPLPAMPDRNEEAPEALWKRFPTFMANVEKIGSLGPYLAGEITVFYGKMVRSRFRGVSIETRLAERAKLTKDEKSQLVNELDEYSNLQTELSNQGENLRQKLSDASQSWKMPKAPAG